MSINTFGPSFLSTHVIFFAKAVKCKRAFFPIQVFITIREANLNELQSTRWKFGQRQWQWRWKTSEKRTCLTWKYKNWSCPPLPATPTRKKCFGRRGALSMSKSLPGFDSNRIVLLLFLFIKTENDFHYLLCLWLCVSSQECCFSIWFSFMFSSLFSHSPHIRSTIDKTFCSLIDFLVLFLFYF